ncbi:putative membrane protein [Paraburkholderia sp. RAU2J]|nr:putative membrane protein [Paraburkholderia sp. RAU2J]
MKHKPGSKPAGAASAAAHITDDAMAASLHSSALPVASKPAAAHGAIAALLALIALAVAWEWWLAPLRPGGSALVLKALPLLCALPGVWRRRIYTLQWASMLILLYFAEGVVRGWSDHGLSARLGWLQAALAVIFFVCALTYVAPFKRAAKRAAKEAARRAAGDAPENQISDRDTPEAARQSATSPATGPAATPSAIHPATHAAAPQVTTAAPPDPDSHPNPSP